MVIGGRERKVYCFAMILAASRKKAVCFSLKVDAAAIYEAIQELFDELGGVTLELLIDNPKALVIENNPKSEDEIRTFMADTYFCSPEKTVRYWHL